MRKILLLALLLALPGCFRINYWVTRPAGETYKTEYWDNYFIFGFIPEHQTRSVRSFCHDDQLIQVKSYMKPANVVSTFLGLGLNSAATVEGTCLKQQQAGS